MIECPHDACGSLVAYDKLHEHRMDCPHGRCASTEPECDFAGSPAALIIHLRETHSIRVSRFNYGINTGFVEELVPALSSLRQHIISHADGTVFAVLIGKRGTDAVVSFVCVRSMACVKPPYKVKICARGQWRPESLSIEFSADKLKALIEPMSSLLSGTITFEEVMRFLVVPPQYLAGFEPSKN